MTHAAYDCDVLVIGGGIIGLSTAYAFTRIAPGAGTASGTGVMVLEREWNPARHRTGHDSGVIHSGIHCPPGSLKARYALRGAAEMVDFCTEHGIAHAVTGKLIVATERDELPRLHALVQRGRTHGLPVRELGRTQLAEYEPRVRGLAAIRVGTTGVYDFAAVAARLAAEVSAAGGTVRYGAQVVAVDRRPWGVAVRTADGQVVRARVLVNCAGLHSDRVALLAGDDPGVRIVPFCGASYELTRPELVRGLVCPVPDPAFPLLGAHLTRGFDGTVRIGPAAVPAPAREGYGRPGSGPIAGQHWRYGAGEVRRSPSKRAVTRAVRRLLPEVTEDDLRHSPAGVRARAVLRDGTPVDDLLIREGPHTVHVLNAPLSAATASLPIGREVARRALLRACGTGWKPPTVESGHCV